MFEFLVPATDAQLEFVGQDQHQYDLTVSPDLVCRAIEAIQQGAAEPDVWKLEGMDDQTAANNVVAQVHTGSPKCVGIIVLGRGENENRVEERLTIGAQPPGFIGFAVGRTVFWKPLLDYKDESVSRGDAVSRISGTYTKLHNLFVAARAATTT